MYKKHFDLERRVFRGNAAGADVFVGPQAAKILAGIKKALAGPDAIVTVTGPVGAGKSTAVAHSLGAISGKNAIVRIGRFPLQRGEVLDLLFDHMRIQQRPPRGNQKLALFRQLLFNLAENESRMFILVEDAPFLGENVLSELEVLTAADSGPSDGANIILMGDDTLPELLSSKMLARMRQRVRLRRKLDSCTVDELGGYLRHCFRQVGGDFDKVFAADALAALHELSGGILRVTNNLVESSMEAAAEAKADQVEVDVIARIANDEFGLTGTFTAPPQIADDTPEPEHTDDATAELVALSMPEAEIPDLPEPDNKPEPPPAPEPEPQLEPELTVAEPQADDDIPELIQDTQPALSILPEAPEAGVVPELIQDTLPNLEVLSPELAQQAEALEALETPQASKQAVPAAGKEAAPKPVTAKKPTSKPDVEKRPAPKAKVKQEPIPKPVTTKKPAPKPEARKQPVPTTAVEQDPVPKPAVEKEATPVPGAENRPAPSAIQEPELQLEPDTPAVTVPAAGDTIAEQNARKDDDKPDWDRDPTLAELQPDLEALERAMAVAQGRDPDADEDEQPLPVVEEKKKDATLAGVPEITLDDSINRKVDAAALDQKQRQEEETGVIEEEEADPKADTQLDEKRQQQAEAEIEKIAEGLAQAKTIEDVDDKMAETLFGEELSIAAAAVAKRVAKESDAKKKASSHAEPAPAATAPPANGSQDPMEKEFEKVWGEKPSVDVSIESQIEGQTGGLDLSASQRLATVRALNTDSGPEEKSAPASQDAPAGKPVPIEEQITTTMTQTLEALNVRPDPTPVNDDPDDDEEDEKRGFFSRFKRS
jgi:general secretion pathway protein A